MQFPAGAVSRPRDGTAPACARWLRVPHLGDQLQCGGWQWVSALTRVCIVASFSAFRRPRRVDGSREITKGPVDLPPRRTPHSARPSALQGREGDRRRSWEAPMSAQAKPDFEQIFQHMPGLCLVLDPAFIIVAQNQEHARATQTEGGRIVGQHVFAAFPDNPDDSGAIGVARIRDSLLAVLKTRKADHLPMLRYDVKPQSGPYVTRYWSVTNIPLLGDDGYVRWILIRAEDMTELAAARAAEQNDPMDRFERRAPRA
jgi:PAS domain-containing protein